MEPRLPVNPAVRPGPPAGQAEPFRYRLGLDLGSNSIGWCVLDLDAGGRPCGVRDAGVRILSPNDEAGRDPQSKTSLAAERRDARSARRRRGRFVRRRDRLMETLIGAGLMPVDRTVRKSLERLDPYALRKEALDRRLSPSEIGRALFHLNQRRGFKSNRIISDSDHDERSSMKQGIKRLEVELESAGVRTLGELLANGRLGPGGGSVRFRPERNGSKNLYAFYPTRSMIESEVDAIWKSQRRWHSDLLTDELLRKIKHIIVDQRPLKPQVPGRCTLFSEDERAPKAHPLFQRFRIFQDVGSLRVREGLSERPLRLDERDHVVLALASCVGAGSGGIVPFERLRAHAGLLDGARLNSEGAADRRKGFACDETSLKLRSKNAFDRVWDGLPHERRCAVVERLLEVQDEAGLCSWLRREFGLSPEAAEFVSGVRLPQGYGHLGLPALRGLVEVFEKESEAFVDSRTGEVWRRPLTYDEAVGRLGVHHSDFRPSARLERLPYYGEVLPRSVVAREVGSSRSQERRGRVSNPTVHIGLNQLRVVVNALLSVYGPPSEIVVELARELKLSRQRKIEVLKENRENRQRNDRIRETLGERGVADTYESRLRMRLYEQLPASEHVCVYTGTPISLEMLFGGLVEIDHVLPYSKTLDDGFSNKVLCTIEANRTKGNRAPEDAWSGEALREIVERAERLFQETCWRFQIGAMERFRKEDGHVARHLVDTQYLSRLAKRYLSHVCDPDRVWASPGRLTAMLRARWGLNGILGGGSVKNRRDHRHHAVDAFVIGCTDRGLLQKISRASGQAEELHLDRLFPPGAFPEPFDGYREALRGRIERLVVSHRPDPGPEGQLLKETAYGLVDEDGYNLVFRKPITELTPNDITGRTASRVRDGGLRSRLRHVLARAKEQEGQLPKALANALAEFGRANGIRRVRVLKRTISVRTVSHGDGAFEKGYALSDNHRVEIYALPDGTWRGEGVSVYDANRPGFEPSWPTQHPEARLVMRIHRGDSVEADLGSGRCVYRICSLDHSANRFRLALHVEAGSLGARHQDGDDPFRWEMKSYSVLKRAGARRVHVDPIGRVRLVVERA